MRRAQYKQINVDDQEAVDEFHAKVNMTGRELEAWLATGEAVADEPVRRIVSILGKRRVDYNSSDIAHMRKVVGYINRHLAQRPEGPTDPAWRQSLLHWGHDPDKTQA